MIWLLTLFKCLVDFTIIDTMKYNALLMIALLFVGVQACKEVEPSDPDPKGDTSIVGTWNFDGLDIKNGSYSVGGVTMATYHSESSNEQGTITFDDNGLMTANIGYTNTFTMVIFGQSQTETEDVPMESSSEPYTFNSSTNTLTVGEGEDEMVFNVTGLGTSAIKLLASINEVVEDSGTVMNSKADWELSLSK